MSPQGKLVWFIQWLATLLGMGGALRRVAYAPTLADQLKAWDDAWFVSLMRAGPGWLVVAIVRFLSLIFCNRVVLWCGKLLATSSC